MGMLKTLYDYLLGLEGIFRLQQILVRKLNPGAILGEWWVVPMGGQARRSKKILEIIDNFKPDLIIETGTFIGSTTPILAIISGVPVVTIEFDKRLALRNKKNFKRLYPALEIEQIIGSSEKELRLYLLGVEKSRKVFAYLDAHWFDYLPVTDELISLVQWGGEFIALIDDFENPYDSGYGFDQYKNGNTIGMHLIPRNLGLRCFVPAIDSAKEGVNKRGTAYVFSKTVLNKENELIVNELREVNIS